MQTMFIPVTKNNFQFLKVTHPGPFRLSPNDNLCLILVSLYKINARAYRAYHEKFDNGLYSHCIKIEVYENVFNQVDSISLSGITAVNAKIDQLIKDAAYEYVKKARKAHPKTKIRTALTDFINFYGLSMNATQLASLDKNERRKRDKAGELLYKRKSKNVINANQLESRELRANLSA